MSEILTLEYNLAELPSSQHRAGLAGLVLMVDWLKGEIEKDDLDDKNIICRRVGLDETNAGFEINQEGLNYLFDKVYAASTENQERNKVIKNSRTKEIIQYIDTFEKDVLNEKTGEFEKKTVYIYPQTIPHGAFLVDYDQSEKGIWVKLWRDLIWGILFSRDKQRLPYKARAEKTVSKEGNFYWKLLTKTPNKEIELSSTQFIGTEGTNAENVSFTDIARHQFLLHFWSFVAQIYVPMTTEYDRKKKTEEIKFKGYSLTIPDILNLKIFCDKLKKILLNERDNKKLLYYPRQSVVDVAAEGALDFMSKLNRRMSDNLIESRASRVLLGIDVIHLEKQGNSIRIWGNNRINPSDDTADFETVKKAYFNYTFRRQRMLNVLNKKDWFYGFDSLLSKTDSEQTIGNSFFRADVRKAFEDIGITNKSKGANFMDAQTKEAVPKKLEEVIYDLVSTYIREKVRDKYQSEWNKLASDTERNKHNELRGKVAREAFLAIRSRTDDDFIEYFASSICSYHQFSLNGDGFHLVAQALYDEEKRNQVRTLTMLALSAKGYSPKSEKQGENQ